MHMLLTDYLCNKHCAVQIARIIYHIGETHFKVKNLRSRGLDIYYLVSHPLLSRPIISRLVKRYYFKGYLRNIIFELVINRLIINRLRYDWLISNF